MVENLMHAPGMLRVGDERDLLVSKFELEKEDVMKFKGLYEAVALFLQEEGYGHAKTTSLAGPGDINWEDLFWERWSPSGAKEQNAWWRVAKYDSNPYIRYFVSISFQMLNVTKAEVAYKNKKVNAERPDLIIRCECWMQWDYDDKFKNSMFGSFTKQFRKYFYHEEWEQKRKDFERFSWRMQRLMRTFLEMAVDQEAPVGLFPPLGYKE
jgi:hypothetical protein